MSEVKSIAADPAVSREAGVPWLSFVTLGVCAAFVVYYNIAVCSRWMLDDAFITFRYSENLAAGFGPVFNPGEAPVEGYTNFTWMLLLAGCIRLGFDPVAWSQIFAAAFAGGTLALLIFSHRFARGISPATAAVAGLLLASFGIFHPWIASGLEATLFMFLLLLTVLLHSFALAPEATRARYAALGIVCALTALTRPEGAVIAGIVLAHHGLRALFGRDHRAWWAIALFLLLFGSFLAWRVWYYGYPVPNTFYAKVGGTQAQVLRGLNYFQGFAAFAWPLLLPVALGMLAVPFLLRRMPWLAVLAGGILLYTLFAIVVGGDVFIAFRFFAHVAALLCLMAAVGLHYAVRPVALRAFLLPLVVGGNLWMAFTHPYTFDIPKRGDSVTLKGVEVGQWLHAYTAGRPQALIATNTAGTIPYYSKRPVIDMLGLNDTQIAHRHMPRMGRGQAGHEKGDGAYVLSRKPDIIHFASSLGGRKPRFIGDREIASDPAFKRDYVYREFRLPSGRKLGFYERRSASAESTNGDQLPP